jgi:transcriptional regulator with XRE-family HTH domain
MRTRPVNSRIRHGDPGCANYGCKRDECLKARNRAMKHREYLARTGRPGRPTTDRTAAHITKLRAAGMTDAQIREAAGIGRDALYKAARAGGTTSRITETKILAVPVPATQTGSANLARIDGHSTLLRLRALVARGWTQRVIAREMGMTTPGYLSRLMRQRGNAYVTLATAQKVQRVYDLLWDQDPIEHGVPAGSVTRAKAMAAAGKWRKPMALDDDVLDDPVQSRVSGISPRKKRTPRPARSLRSGSSMPTAA